MLDLDGAKLISAAIGNGEKLQVTIYRDSDDRSQFYYMPPDEMITLARHKSGSRKGKYIFNMVRYQGEGEEKGGAFLLFEVNMALPEEILNAVKKQIPSEFSEWMKKADSKKVNLSCIDWQDGDVVCEFLDMRSDEEKKLYNSDDDKSSDTPVARTFVNVISGATKPSLGTANTAIFSAHLTERGAQTAEKMFTNQQTPIGIHYTLRFKGLEPSFKVRITANYENLYKNFQVGIEGEYKFLKGGIEYGIKKAMRNKDINIEITDYDLKDDTDYKKKLEAWVLDFFSNMVMKEWMTPVLAPADFTEDGGKSGEGGGDGEGGEDNLMSKLKNLVDEHFLDDDDKFKKGDFKNFLIDEKYGMGLSEDMVDEKNSKDELLNFVKDEINKGTFTYDNFEKKAKEW